MVDVEVRTLVPGDEALFVRIAEGVFDHSVDRATLAGYLTTPGHHLVVALRDGEVVGQAAAVVHRHPDRRSVELYFDEVGVAPAFQRCGIARRMLKEMFALGRSLGCTEAWLDTEPATSRRALYGPTAASAENVVIYVFRLILLLRHKLRR